MGYIMDGRENVKETPMLWKDMRWLVHDLNEDALSVSKVAHEGFVVRDNAVGVIDEEKHASLLSPVDSDARRNLRYDTVETLARLRVLHLDKEPRIVLREVGLRL